MSDIYDTPRRDDILPIIDNGLGNNFSEWQIKTCIALESTNMWDHIEGPNSIAPNIPPLREAKRTTRFNRRGEEDYVYTPGNAAERHQLLTAAQPWLRADRVIRAKLIKAILGRYLRNIRQYPFAKDVWNALADIYTPQNSIRAESAKADIMNYSCTPDMDVAKWLEEMQSLFDALCSM